jgi:hypothetical protein
MMMTYLPGIAQDTIKDIIQQEYFKKSGNKKAVEKASKEQNTGKTTFAGGIEGTIKNFEPLFSGLLESRESAADGESITLDLNLPSFLEGRVKLRATLSQPRVADPIKKMFPEETRASLVETLEEGLSDTDDLTWQLSFNFAKGRYGRTYNERNLGLFYKVWHQVFDIAVDWEPADELADLIDYNRLESLVSSDQKQAFLEEALVPVNNAPNIEDLIDDYGLDPEHLNRIFESADKRGHRWFKREDKSHLETVLEQLAEELNLDYKTKIFFINDVMSIFEWTLGPDFTPVTDSEIDGIIDEFHLSAEFIASLFIKNGDTTIPILKTIPKLITDINRHEWTNEETRANFQEYMTRLHRMHRAKNQYEDNPGNIPVKFFPEAEVKKLRASIARFVKVEKDLDKAIYEKMKAFKIDQFTNLVNNQPQINLSIDAHRPNELVDQKSYTLKASYELPLGHNVNSLQKALKNKEDGEIVDVYLNHFLAPNKAKRFAFDLSIEELKEHELTLAQLASPYTFKADNKVLLEAGYGQYLRVRDDGTGLDRVDVKIAWEHYRKEEEKQNRFIAALTYTPQPGKLISFPITFMYANHGEYLTDTKAELSAHLGIAF